MKWKFRVIKISNSEFRRRTQYFVSCLFGICVFRDPVTRSYEQLFIQAVKGLILDSV